MTSTLAPSQSTHERVEEALLNVQNRIPGASDRLAELKTQGLTADAEQAQRFMNRAWVGFLNHEKESQGVVSALVNAGIEVPIERASFGLKKEIEIFQNGGYDDPDLSKKRLKFLSEINIGPKMPEFDIAMRGALRDIRDKQSNALENYEFLKSLGGSISPEVGEYALKNSLRDAREGAPDAKGMVSFLRNEGAVASIETASHYLLLASQDFVSAPKTDPSLMQTLKEMGGRLGPEQSNFLASKAADQVMANEPQGLEKLKTLYGMDIKMDAPTQDSFLSRITNRIRQGIEGAKEVFESFAQMGIKKSGVEIASKLGHEQSTVDQIETRKVNPGMRSPQDMADRFSALMGDTSSSTPSKKPAPRM